MLVSKHTRRRARRRHELRPGVITPSRQTEPPPASLPIYKPFSSVWIKLFSAAQPSFGIIVAPQSCGGGGRGGRRDRVHNEALVPRGGEEGVDTIQGNGVGTHLHRPCPIIPQHIQTANPWKNCTSEFIHDPVALSVNAPASALPFHNVLWP